MSYNEQTWEGLYLGASRAMSRGYDQWVFECENNGLSITPEFRKVNAALDLPAGTDYSTFIDKFLKLDPDVVR